MTKSSLALLASVSFAAACGGVAEGSGGSGTTPPYSADSPGAEQCETEWRGPWTACPQADWVLEVAERAGYRVTGERGSALVAQGSGQSFYIWATRRAKGQGLNVGPSASEGRFGEVAGVAVYGDEALWRWWRASGFVYWLQAGPYGDSRLPRLAEMDLLVQASTPLAPPGAEGRLRYPRRV